MVKIVGEKMFDMNDKQNRLLINKIEIIKKELIRTNTPKSN